LIKSSSASSIPANHQLKLNKQSRAAKTWQQFKKSKYLQLLALPGIIYYVIFHYIPMYGVIIAFKDYKMKLGILGSPWVGLKHFENFINQPDFLKLLSNTVLINFYQLLFAFPAPIILALFLNELKNAHAKKFVQTVSYLPHFISTVSIVGMITVFLSPDGPINRAIVQGIFHQESIYFIVKPEWFRSIYISTDIWQGIGWGAIVYLAALAGVNSELYEAAAIDGCSRVKRIWYITLPSIQPTIIIMLLFKLGGMLNLGADKVLLMQNALNKEVSDVISTYVYRRGLERGEYSFSTAVGVFNSVINFTLLWIANKTAKNLTENSLW
jgi:putative aldouronate transport system permease protein